MSQWGKERKFVTTAGAIRVIAHVAGPAWNALEPKHLIDDLLMQDNDCMPPQAGMDRLAELRREWIGRSHGEWERADAPPADSPPFAEPCPPIEAKPEPLGQAPPPGPDGTGGLAIGLDVDINGNIRLEFGKPVAWLTMPPAQALGFAKLLERMATVAQGARMAKLAQARQGQPHFVKLLK